MNCDVCNKDFPFLTQIVFRQVCDACLPKALKQDWEKVDKEYEQEKRDEFDGRLEKIVKYTYLEDKPLKNKDLEWLIQQLRTQNDLKNLQTKIIDDSYRNLVEFMNEIQDAKKSLNAELEKDLGDLKPLRIGELSGIELIESKFLKVFGE